MRLFRWTSYGMYLLGGMSAVVFGSILTELISHYHVSYSSGGILVFLQAIGFMTGVPVVSALMRRVRYQFILSGSAFAVALAQGLMLFLPPLPWLFTLAILNGIGASALETAVATYIMEVFVGQRAVFMSRLEVSFGLGALVLPAIASGLIRVGSWQLVFAFMFVCALILTVLWLRVSFDLTDSVASEQLDALTHEPPQFRKRHQRYVVLGVFLFMIFVYVGLEGSLNGFLPSVFTTDFGQQASRAALSSSTFWGAMVVGRLAIGFIARRVSYERYLLYSVMAALVCLVFLAESRAVWFVFVLVFMLGVSMSAIYSITMVYANHTFRGMERAVTSLVTAFAGIGGAVFPAALGFAMDHFRPSVIVWMLVSFAVLLFVCLMTVFAMLRGIRAAYGQVAQNHISS